MPIDQSSLQTICETLRKFPNSDLLIVTKNRSEKDIKELIDIGFKRFGENRVQEADKKFNQYLNEDNHSLELHLIGPLQSNKVKKALEIFNIIQSIDRKKLIDEISKEKIKQNKIKCFGYFLQVNIGEEKQKSGVLPKDLEDLYHYAISKDLNVLGLMCIPPNDDDPELHFGLMRDLRNKLNNKLKLSMGMSSDYEVALNCGSNIIRVGSKIFL